VTSFFEASFPADLATTMALPDVTTLSYEKLAAKLAPTPRKLLSLFSLFAALVFILAVIITAAVRAQLEFSTPPATVLSSIPVTAMTLPVLTVCPMFVQSVLSPLECVFEDGPTVVADCLSQVVTVQVTIENIQLNCLQYNNIAAPFVATSSASELGSKTYVDSSLVPVGEPIGLYAMVHTQSVAPVFGWNNVFIGNPGDVHLVLLQNTTHIHADGSTQEVNFAISVSHAGTALNDTTSTKTVDVDVIYPQMVAYYDTEVPIYVQHSWVGEIGGLAALLFFLHNAVMWLLAIAILGLGGGGGNGSSARKYESHHDEEVQI